MRVKEYLVKKLMEVWSWEIVLCFFAFLVTFVIAIVGKDYWPFLGVFMFFLGMFIGKQVYTPAADKPVFGFKYVSDDELYERKRGKP